MSSELRTRVIYIAGLSRGGSTILQKYLATHPDLVSAGETHFALRVLTGEPLPHPDWTCACGKSRQECELWGPLVERLRGMTPQEGSELLLERFRAIHPGKILIDSSKEPRGLKLFYLDKARSGEIDLQVIVLVRDVRSWATSIRKYRKGGSSFVLEAYRWMKATLNWLRILRKVPIPAYCLSYESFVFHTETEIAGVAQWLGVENHFSDERLAQATTHELFGSPTVRQPEKRERLVYDDTWLRALGPSLLAPFIFPALLVNRWIYRSLAGKALETKAKLATRSALQEPAVTTSRIRPANTR